MVAEIVSTGSYLPGEPITMSTWSGSSGRCPRMSWRASRSPGATGWSTRDRRAPRQQLEMAANAAREALTSARDRPVRGRPARLSTAQPRLPAAAAGHLRPGTARPRSAARRWRSARAAPGVGRGARHRPALPRGGPVQDRGRDRQRGDLAAARPGVPRQGPGEDPHARPHEPLQLRRRRGRGGAARERGRPRASSARRWPASAASKKPAMQIIGAGTHAPVHEQLQAQAPGRSQGRRRRVRPLHALRAHRGR